MHNVSVNTFEDISRHLELEAERREAAKFDGSAMVVESNSCRTSQFKRGKEKGGPKKQVTAALNPNGARNFKRRGKRGDKKVKAKLTCFNCNKEGHFTRDCPEQKKVLPYLISRIQCFVLVKH